MTEADKTHLRFALGWLELGDYASALEELDRIEAASRTEPEVLNLRWDIAIHAREYDSAVEAARLLTQIVPAQFEGWWKLSFVLHEMGRTQEAYDNLASVLEQFSGEWLAHYNLACYLTRLARLDEARVHLAKAFALNPDQRRDALEDPDLEPLHAEIRRKPAS